MLPCECDAAPRPSAPSAEPQVSSATHPDAPQGPPVAAAVVVPSEPPSTPPPAESRDARGYSSLSIGGGYGAGTSSGSHVNTIDFGPLLSARLGHTSRAGVSFGLVYLHGFGSDTTITDPSLYTPVVITSVWNAGAVELGAESAGGVFGVRGSVGIGAAFHDLGCERCPAYGLSAPPTKVAFLGTASLVFLLRTRWVHLGVDGRVAVVAASDVARSGVDVLEQFMITGFAGLSLY